MDNLEYNIKIELAKQWFVYAQISIILAGFFFATFGVAYANNSNSLSKVSDTTLKSLDIFNSELGKINFNLSIEVLNKSVENLFLYVQANLRFATFLLKIAAGLVIISVVFCLVLPSLRILKKN